MVLGGVLGGVLGVFWMCFGVFWDCFVEFDCGVLLGVVGGCFRNVLGGVLGMVFPRDGRNTSA